MIVLRALLATLLCLPLAAQAQETGETGPGSLWLTNVRVIDVQSGQVTAPRDVLIRNGRVEAIAARMPREAGEGVTLIDGDGGWLMPALAEMHAHVPSASQGSQQIQDVLSLFLARGVTTIRGMLGEPAHLELRDQLAAGIRQGPRLLTSGPSFNGNTVTSPEQGAQRVREQAALGYDFLKIHPGLSREEFVAIAEAARAVDIPIAGHVSYETGLDTALAYDQATIDHLDAYAEAMVPPGHALHGQAPQFFGLNLADGMDSTTAGALARRTAAAGVWQVPTQSLFETITGPLSLEELEARPGMDLLSDGLRANWTNAVTNIRQQMTETQRARFLDARRALLKAMQEEGVGLLLGSDAPQIMNVPGFSAHQELAYLVQAGLTPLEALQTGTLNVARFLGEADRGQVAPGMIADLILLEANPLDDIGNTTRIAGVMHGGAWLDRGQLARMIDDVRSRGL
ncbi:MAG: amidohydrolase family protein [Xanthomonadales bacterium]|jgi:imidazolonepropionase-like amidohydrolase|nr:amidohydrolase family protein [Xanthomonadales bacterium]